MISIRSKKLMTSSRRFPYLFANDFLLARFNFLCQSPSDFLRLSKWRILLIGIAISWLISLVMAGNPALGADQIAFHYKPLEVYLSVSDLEDYANAGEISDELAFYLQRFDPQKKWLKSFLNATYSLTEDRRRNLIEISNFLYSPLGEMLLQYMGGFIQTDSRLNGFSAIRAAVILSAADSKGVTPMNLLKKFPTQSIIVDAKKILTSLEVAREEAHFLRQQIESLSQAY